MIKSKLDSFLACYFTNYTPSSSSLAFLTGSASFACLAFRASKINEMLILLNSPLRLKYGFLTELYLSLSLANLTISLASVDRVFLVFEKNREINAKTPQNAPADEIARWARIGRNNARNEPGREQQAKGQEKHTQEASNAELEEMAVLVGKIYCFFVGGENAELRIGRIQVYYEDDGEGGIFSEKGNSPKSYLCFEINNFILNRVK